MKRGVGTDEVKKLVRAREWGGKNSRRRAEKMTGEDFLL